MPNANPTNSCKEMDMKTAYDLKQKILLMAIAMVSGLILLGLNACQ